MILGIEISSDGLRAGCLDRLRLGRLPEHLGEEVFSPLPPDADPDEAALAEALRPLLDRLDAGRASVAVAVPSAWCAFRVVSLPYRSGSRVERTLRYALEGRLPGAVEDYVIEPVSDIITSRVRGARVLVAACPATRIQTVLAAFQKEGTQPCILQPAAVAVTRYLKTATPRGATRDALLLRIGRDVTELTVLEDENPILCHAIRMDRIEPREPGDVERIVDRIRLALRADEVSRGAVYCHRVLLLAPPETGPLFVGALQEKLGVPVELLVREGAEGSWAGAWGAAMEAAKRKHAAPNLRRGPYAYAPYARRVQRKAVAALGLALSIVCLLGLHVWRAGGQVGRALTHRRDLQAVLCAQVTGDRQSRAPVRLMESVLKQAEQEAARSRRSRVTSCLHRWVALMELVPKDSGIHIREMSIDQRRVAVKGEAKDSRQVWKFRNRAQKSTSFIPETPEVTRNPLRRNWSFTMELKYRE